MKRFYVYILASRRNGTLYTGVTSDISRRAFEHCAGAAPGFTRRHSIKRWPRQWKINAIERDNPEWFDLFRRLNR